MAIGKEEWESGDVMKDCMVGVRVRGWGRRGGCSPNHRDNLITVWLLLINDIFSSHRQTAS